MKEKDFGDQFSIESNTILQILTNWINVLHIKLKKLPIWTSCKTENQSKSACFKANKLATRITDCTELFLAMTSSFRALSQMHSSYKGHSTAKSLASSEIVTYISCLYGGYISDKKITQGKWPC